MTAAPLESMDSSFRAIIAIQDITELKQIGEELRESRNQLSDIISFFADATFVIDKMSRVIAWNRAIEVMTGIKRRICSAGKLRICAAFLWERPDTVILP